MDNLTNQNIHYQQQVVDWSIFLTCIALLVAIARFTARWQGYAARNDFNWIDWDDFLIVPALISTIVVGVCWSGKYSFIARWYRFDETQHGNDTFIQFS